MCIGLQLVLELYIQVNFCPDGWKAFPRGVFSIDRNNRLKDFSKINKQNEMALTMYSVIFPQFFFSDDQTGIWESAVEMVISAIPFQTRKSTSGGSPEFPNWFS